MEVKITRANQITIPKKIIEKLKLKQGEKLIILIEGDRIILYPKKIKEIKVFSIKEKIDWKKSEEIIEKEIEKEWK